MRYLKLLSKLDAHHRLIISIIVALGTYLWMLNVGFTPISFLIIWLSYSVCYLLLCWVTILFNHPLNVNKAVLIQDASKSFIFIFVLVAALAGLFSVVLMLGSTKNMVSKELIQYTLLSIGSVITSWWIVHTVFTFRYAHLYYQKKETNKEISLIRGLDFPNDNKPDYQDFAYFSFVIGMTFQVSDVKIQSKKIRRLCLLHALISFLFNTVIIALSISIISNLL